MKEIALLEKRSNKQADRGDTFVGFRPTVFKSAKHDKKTIRRSGKEICRKYL